MRLSRADRSRVADWWFTVDRTLLAVFMVLIGATMPSVLAEISFLTNRQEGSPDPILWELMPIETTPVDIPELRRERFPCIRQDGIGSNVGIAEVPGDGPLLMGILSDGVKEGEAVLIQSQFLSLAGYILAGITRVLITQVGLGFSHFGAEGPEEVFLGEGLQGHPEEEMKKEDGD